MFNTNWKLFNYKIVYWLIMLKDLNKVMQANVILNINQHIHEPLIERCWLMYAILGKAGYIPAEINRRADQAVRAFPLLINLSYLPCSYIPTLIAKLSNKLDT